MKIYLILSVVVIQISGTGCKKNTQDVQPIDVSPAGKRWRVTTVAGDGSPFFKDGPALMSEFRAPQDVAVTPDGIVYVADALNHRIRKIAEGKVTTFAGYERQDTISGIGTTAGFATPVSIVSDRAGNLYTLDVNDFRVRKISAASVVTVAAGNGVRGFADGTAATAMFGESFGIDTDNDGNIYVSDWDNRRIRKISVSGDVTTIAGPFQFGPGGIAIDKDGNLYVVDQGSFRIRKISSTGEISTFAGSGIPGDKDGNADEAQFSFNMRDIVVDSLGNLYFSDDNRIRKITPQGIVSTIAGSTFGYRDGDGATAKFESPNGLAIDAHGNIYVADITNSRIRKISFE